MASVAVVQMRRAIMSFSFRVDDSVSSDGRRIRGGAMTSLAAGLESAPSRPLGRIEGQDLRSP